MQSEISEDIKKQITRECGYLLWRVATLGRRLSRTCPSGKKPQATGSKK